jgi:glycosyltransferase involved in cell wall biosynthesis
MRILYAGAVNVGRGRGDAIHFLHLAHALQARGHKLTILARGHLNKDDKRGLEIYAVPYVRLPKGTTLFNDLLMHFRIATIVMREKFDVLYYRGIPLASQWAHLLGIPSVVEVNGIWIDELKIQSSESLRLRIRQKRENSLIEQAQRIICVTEGIREQLMSRYGVFRDKCVVIPNATDVELFSPQPKHKCQKRVGVESKYYNVGFVGAFQHWIDFDMLFDAVQALWHMDVPVRCTLVGDGYKYEEIREKIKRNGLGNLVHLVGFVPHRTVPDWIGAFDVCVAPFTSQRNQAIGVSPLKLYEYLACGRPVVVPALPGIIQTIQVSRSGFLYPVGDVEKLTQHLHTLYKNVDLRKQMQTRGREYVVKHHNWTNVAEKTEAIMMELSNQKSNIKTQR